MSNEGVNAGTWIALLGVLFIGLKILGIINWPWVWVLLPLWGPTLVVMCLLVLAFIIGILVAFLQSRKK